MKSIKLIFPVLWLVMLTGGVLSQSAAPKDPVTFSHKLHIEQEELECTDCHAQVEASVTGSDNLMPLLSGCLDCHKKSEIGHYAAAAEQLPGVLDYSPLFSHKLHVSAEQACATCHQAILDDATRALGALPTMLECLDCHESKSVMSADIVNECSGCHQPGDNLQPASHSTGQFVHNHADLAMMSARAVSADMTCATCHKQSFCQDCHEGDNLARETHPLNFQFTHALVAQLKEAECSSCHTERQFCIDCHRDNNVFPRSHTVGFVNNFPGDGGRHRVEALNDLNACMSCHEQNAQQICETCHGN